MEISGTLLVGLLTLLILFIFIRLKKKSNLPPGPEGVPVLGCFPFLKVPFFVALEDYGKKWGDLFTIKLGMRKVVILNSFEVIKEALVNQGHSFSGRIQDEFLRRISRRQGVVLSEGDSWKHQRRTALRILKDFGFGREGSKEVIQNELEDMFQMIDAKNGAPILTQRLFNYCTANIINSLAVNERPAYVDEDFQKVLQRFDKIVQTTIFEFMPIFFPALNSIPYYNNIVDHFFHIVENAEFCHNYVRRKIAEHKKNFDPEQEPKDFIDAMLLLQKDAESEPNYTPELYDHRIVRTVTELFLAGMDTTATTLCWLFFLLSHNPDVQKRVQEEIDKNCDGDSRIKVEDKKKLPYTCAVLDESVRYASIVPTSVFHRTTEDTKLLDFDIPENTIVIPFTYGVHHNPKYWKHPEKFYPEHFLTPDGKEYQPNERLIPFSVGPRSCMGEMLANLELFLITTSLLRRYTIKPSQTYSTEEMQMFLKGKNGTIRRILPHELIFLKRK